jgi:hypothetical protein
MIVSWPDLFGIGPESPVAKMSHAGTIGLLAHAGTIVEARHGHGR